jgi:3',5'-nucleoside bisphosphate phosphatase
LGYDDHRKIDLHIHSTASDGTSTPAEILNIADELNIGAIAITDHDTIDGSREALTLGIPPSMEFLTGIEISAAMPKGYAGKGSFHVLGYGIDLENDMLNQTLERLQQARRERNPLILERLGKFGFELTMKEVLMEAGDKGQPGRPHICRVMIKKGYVHSISEAFDKYLGTGKAAYVDKYRVNCSRAAEIIIASGGIPVLAHPGLLRVNHGNSFEKLVQRLKEIGFVGIEVYYPEHSARLTDYYAHMAKRHGLLLTGGTDFHGRLKPDIKIGSGNGDLNVPYPLYKTIKQELENRL